MKKSEKTKCIIAGVFSAVLAFNCLSAGGVKTFAADADFAEERTAEEIIKELEEKGMHGDINADGTINVLDVIRYKQVFLAKETVADEQLYHADANDDGVINSADFITVIKDILGESVIWSYQRMPKMDGSTSAIPLEAGFKSKMLGILKITQDNDKEVWRFVPLQNFTETSDIDWTQSIADIDRQLYSKYGLTQEEIDFIETHVKEME